MSKMPGPLSGLSEEQCEQMFAWLSMGMKDRDIAKKIQIDNGWLLDVKMDSLVRAVNRWRKSQAQNAVVLAVAHKMTDSRGMLRSHLDVMAELETLIEKQRKRIAGLSEKEGDLNGLLLESLSNEMMRMVAMLEKLGKFQLETGVMRRVRIGQVKSDYEDDIEDAEYVDVTDDMEAAMQETARKYGAVLGAGGEC